MLIIFNYVGVALCVLAVFAGWGVKFSAWALGFSESTINFSFLASWAAVIALLDLACRSMRLFDSSPRNWGRFVAPTAGGHLFFIPIWILATVLLTYHVGRMFV